MTLDKIRPMKFSRHMPKKEPPDKPKWWGILLVVVWAGGLLYGVAAMIRQTPLGAWRESVCILIFHRGKLRFSQKPMWWFAAGAASAEDTHAIGYKCR